MHETEAMVMMAMEMTLVSGECGISRRYIHGRVQGRSSREEE